MKQKKILSKINSKLYGKSNINCQIINFSKNITGFLSFETSETKNETKYLKKIYKYRKQLIEENI